MTDTTKYRNAVECVRSTALFYVARYHNRLKVERCVLAKTKRPGTYMSDYAATVNSYRICDVAAFQLARKARVITGVPTIDTAIARPADPETVRLADADVSKARTAIVSHFAPMK